MKKSYTLSWLTLISATLAGSLYYLGGKLLLISSLFIFLTYIFFLQDTLIKKSKRESFFQDFTCLYAEVSILLGILFSQYSNTFFTYFALFGILLTNHIRIQYHATLIDTNCKKTTGVKEEEYGGILPRSNRLVILIFLPLLQYVTLLKGIEPFYGLSLTDLFMLLFAILTNITAVQRFIKAYVQLEK